MITEQQQQIINESKYENIKMAQTCEVSGKSQRTKIDIRCGVRNVPLGLIISISIQMAVVDVVIIVVAFHCKLLTDKTFCFFTHSLTC